MHYIWEETPISLLLEFGKCINAKLNYFVIDPRFKDDLAELVIVYCKNAEQPVHQTEWDKCSS